MYKDGDRCPICGNGILKKIIDNETFSYKGKSITIHDCMFYECPTCGEAIADPGTDKRIERTIKDFHRKIDGLLDAKALAKRLIDRIVHQNDMRRRCRERPEDDCQHRDGQWRCAYPMYPSTECQWELWEILWRIGSSSNGSSQTHR